jgi:hypothetical protein
MDDLYNKIKSIIQAKSCPTHNLPPLVKLSEGVIDINCCCTHFKVICIAEISELLKENNNVKLARSAKRGPNK